MSKDLNIIKQFESADKEEFKRPDHEDFMTAAELSKARFSGVRHNSISQDMECWVEGEIKFSVSAVERSIDPNAWTRKFQDYFGIHHVEVISQKGN